LKESEVIELSKKLGYKVEKVEAIVQEASQRQYFRIRCLPMPDKYKYPRHGKAESFIFCYMNPQLGNHDRLVEINKAFYKNPIMGNYSVSDSVGPFGGPFVPQILSYDKELGVTVQEDVGDKNLYDLIDDLNTFLSPVSSALHSSSVALDLLSSLYFAEIPDLKKLSEKNLIDQMKTFVTVYLKNFLSISSSDIKAQNENIENLIDETITNLNSQPWVNCHTDFEGRNIMIEELLDYNGNICFDQSPCLIDYQDMCIGPAGIDLAGLLFDHYYFGVAEQSQIEELLAEHFDRMSSSERKALNRSHVLTDTDPYLTNNKYGKEMYEYARWGAIQRNMRILGTLSNLYLNDKKSFRLPDLKNILLNLTLAIPNYHSELKLFIKKVVLPINNKKVKEII
jgi:aminoglycoside/choline kinase family phosphotransferase